MHRMTSLRDRAHKFKVSKNAEQLMLTGCGIMGSDTNVVIVEGSERAIKQYKKLMMNRIKWDEASAPEEGDENADMADKGPNKCVLMWEVSNMRDEKE